MVADIIADSRATFSGIRSELFELMCAHHLEGLTEWHWPSRTRARVGVSRMSRNRINQTHWSHAAGQKAVEDLPRTPDDLTATGEEV
jgi:hypothetical protein